MHTVTVKQLFVAFFMFGGTVTLFSKNICSSVFGTNRKPFYFCPEVNSARILAEQPIKLREKSYPPLEYMVTVL